jgi:hypothetical protein
MNEVMDTGKWSYKQLLQWKIKQNSNQTRQCKLCRSTGSDMVEINRGDVPRSLEGFYHRHCADQVKAQYKRVCVICGNGFVLRHENGITEMCPDCEKTDFPRLRKVLTGELRQARIRGLQATLTFREWIETLDYFNWRCAYCGHRFELLEHFIPLSLGGGTTRDNCVPGCYSCNTKKRSVHPFEAPIPNIHVVYSYLRSRA